MAKSSKKGKPRKSGFPQAAEKKPVVNNPHSPQTKRPMRWDLLALFLTIAIGGTYLAIVMRPRTAVETFTYEVLKTYKHDPAAFTQGFQMHDGFLWESTGRNGQSSIRKIDLETGEILKQVDLEDKYFGEGLTYHDGLFYQLTWKSGKVFVYDLDLNKVDERSYQGHGWGLTSNGTDLILSEGTATLKFLDPETLEVRRTIRVLRTDGPVGKLNELEYVDYRGGRIYANAYGQDLIYEIEPEHGDVTKVIELFKLWPSRERPSNEAILNGITVNPKNDRWLVTGKLCPTIFELNLFPKEE